MLALFINYNSKKKLDEGREDRKDGGKLVKRGEGEAGEPPTTLPHREELGRNYHCSMRLFYGSYSSPRKGKRLSAIFGWYT